MIGKPSLLNLTALVAAMSVASVSLDSVAIAAEDAPAKKPAATRLGTAIEGDLAKRDKTEAERQRQLDLQQQAVQASQKRLDANLQESNPPEAEQAGATKGGKKGKDADAESEMADQLARIYQSMKAKKAAPVFEKLDLELQIAVARKMRERNTGLILAEMSPDAAARLSMALAGRKVAAKKP